MRTKTFFLLIFFLLITSAQSYAKIEKSIYLIPIPAFIQQEEGSFVINDKTRLSLDFPHLKDDCMIELLKEAVSKKTETKHPLKSKKRQKINIIKLQRTQDTLQPESYRMNITEKSVTIEASDEAGLFYGIQTLIQLLPNQEGKTKSIEIPCLNIKDTPRFSYRGMHLDVSRHFFSKEFVCKFIESMASYKLNNLHLHLTDAAGWRIEIKKYPRLTDIAAWRTNENWKKWWNSDRKYVQKGDTNAHGGYYSQKDIKEIVKFATRHHINIIPEIEMPGHSEEVLAVYPELSCSGEPYKNSDFCIGNEQTFQFMENVLTEIMDLFPSQYIHIGGDEAGKKAWHNCPKCQERIRQENLKDVDELQSYMIRRIEKFLIAHGRKLIGWDEILEGGLAPEATVMSWRGEEGGILAAKAGHNAIMTPSAYCYFDAYQASPETQPEAIGGYLPVKKVYSYNPTPNSIEPQIAQHILGTQANVWTEYIPTQEHVEYMVFPRLLALAELNWSPQEKRSWESFKPRLNAHLPLLKAKNINTFPLSYEIDVQSDVDTIKKVVTVSMDAEKYPAEIHYTLDGSCPTKESPIYTQPLYIKDSASICAALFENGELMKPITSKRLDYHRAIGKPLFYNKRYYSGYAAGGDQSLNDGLRGGFTYKDNRWQGFLTNFDVVIDMGEITEISQIQANFMQIIGPGVYFPESVTIEISEDGVHYQPLALINNPVSPDLEGVWFRDFGFEGKAQGRYIRYFAKKHSGFLFIDEIRVW